MTARMNYYNLLGKTESRGITSNQNIAKNINDLDILSLDFSHKQSLIESFVISTMSGPDQQPVMVSQHPSVEDCNCSDDIANAADFLYVQSLPHIVMRTMKS